VFERRRTIENVGPGWEPLLRELCEAVDPLIQKFKQDMIDSHDTDDAILNELEHPTCMQCKEKFGGLRFYMSRSNEGIDKAIRIAEEKSYQTCDECGAPGKPRNGGWLVTRCDNHSEGKGACTFGEETE
jgi:hypothetical protein